MGMTYGEYIQREALSQWNNTWANHFIQIEETYIPLFVRSYNQDGSPACHQHPACYSKKLIEELDMVASQYLARTDAILQEQDTIFQMPETTIQNQTAFILNSEVQEEQLVNVSNSQSQDLLTCDIETNFEEHMDDIILENGMELSEQDIEEPIVLAQENQVMEEPTMLTKEKLPNVLEEKPIEVFQAYHYIDPIEVYIDEILISDNYEISRYLQKLDASSPISIERLLQELGRKRTKPLPTNQRFVFLEASYENPKLFKDQSLNTLVDPT